MNLNHLEISGTSQSLQLQSLVLPSRHISSSERYWSSYLAKICPPGRWRQKPSVKQEERGSNFVPRRWRHKILTICEIGGRSGGKPRGSGGSGSLLCAGKLKAVVILQKLIWNESTLHCMSFNTHIPTSGCNLQPRCCFWFWSIFTSTPRPHARLANNWFTTETCSTSRFCFFPCFFYLYFRIYFLLLFFLHVFQNIFLQGQLRPFHKALPCCRCLLAVPGRFFFFGEKNILIYLQCGPFLQTLALLDISALEYIGKIFTLLQVLL